MAASGIKPRWERVLNYSFTWGEQNLGFHEAAILTLKDRFSLVLKGLGTPCSCHFAVWHFSKFFHIHSFVLSLWQEMSTWPESFSERICQGNDLSLGAQMPTTRKLWDLESQAEMCWSLALGGKWAVPEVPEPTGQQRYKLTWERPLVVLNRVSWGANHSG